MSIRRPLLLGLAALILPLFLPGLCGDPVRAGHQAAVTQASGDIFAGPGGVPVTLQSLQGHPAVVNFWATWCGPCREEMPRLQKLADRYAARGVSFVAISLDGAETQSKIEGVVHKRGFRIPVWTGATEGTLKSLQLGELVPSTLIVDEAGQPVGKIEGEAREKDISTRLEWLLNGRHGQQPKLVQKNDW